MKKKTYFAIFAKNLSTGKKEKVDQASNQREAYYLIHEYSLAFGKSFFVYCPQLGDF